MKGGGGGWRRKGGKKCVYSKWSSHWIDGHTPWSFSRGNHLHNGKVVGVVSWELSSCGDSQWSGRRELLSDRGPILLCSGGGSMQMKLLLPVTCLFHLQNNLSAVSEMSAAHMKSWILLLKRLQWNISTFIRLMNLMPCNSFQPTCYAKRKVDWFKKLEISSFKF